MKKQFYFVGWLLASLFLFTNICFAADPVVTDGDKYKMVLENERVRVLLYDDKPGDKTNQHEHSDFVLYAISPFKRKLTFPDGKTMVREFEAGETIWMKRQTHIGENVGTTETHVVIVELKEPAPTQGKKAKSELKNPKGS